LEFGSQYNKFYETLMKCRLWLPACYIGANRSRVYRVDMVTVFLDLLTIQRIRSGISITTSVYKDLTTRHIALDLRLMAHILEVPGSDYYITNINHQVLKFSLAFIFLISFVCFHFALKDFKV
jgi:hypothetical protein